MSNAVVRLRMSKTDHPMPRRANPQENVTGGPGDPETHRAGNTGLDNGQLEPSAPQKYRAFDSTNDKYPYTKIAKAAEVVDGGNEGAKGKSKSKSHRTSKNRN